MNIALWLDRTARVSESAPALFLGEKPIADYGSFLARSAALAHALRRSGIGPGDRVALLMKNCPEYLIALFGIWIAGAAATPINAKLHAKEAAFIIGNAGAKLTFATPPLAEALSGLTDAPLIDATGGEFNAMTAGEPLAVEPRSSDDLAWLFYTSGTTGKPKGVMITHGMLAAMSLCYPVDVDQVTETDAALYAAPISHGAGLYMFIHVRAGARHICPASGGFESEEIMALASRAGPVSMFMAPTMVRRFTDAARTAGDRVAGLKTIVYGGGPMYRADIEEAVDWFGPKFVQIYGQGECPMAITALSRAEVADRSHPNWAARLASAGRAQSLVEIRIGDEDGNPLPPGSSGEIMVRGAPVMPGYWNNPAASAAALKGGWLMTGDVGQLDVDGYLTLQDRSKDVIISGGSNIYPREIEEVLLTHPTVHEASVVGRPSAEWGEEVVAFIVPASGSAIEPDALDAHCLAHVARFKRPKAYFAVDELPKNNYGKVLKTELRKLLEKKA